MFLLICKYHHENMASMHVSTPGQMDIVDLMCSNANVYIRKVVFKKNKIIHLMLIEAFQ